MQRRRQAAREAAEATAAAAALAAEPKDPPANMRAVLHPDGSFGIALEVRLLDCTPTAACISEHFLLPCPTRKRQWDRRDPEPLLRGKCVAKLCPAVSDSCAAAAPSTFVRFRQGSSHCRAAHWFCAAMQSPSPASSESFTVRVGPEDPEVADTVGDGECADVELGAVTIEHNTIDSALQTLGQATAQGRNGSLT